MATCSSCGAEIIWAVTRNNKPIPISSLEYADGNIVLLPDPDPREPPLAHVLAKGENPKLPRRVTHFVDCPSADQHRRPK